MARPNLEELKAEFNKAMLTELRAEDDGVYYYDEGETEQFVEGGRVRLPESYQIGPFGEFGEYETVYLPEYGTLDSFEAGGVFSITPDGFDYDIYFNEEEVSPA